MWKIWISNSSLRSPASSRWPRFSLQLTKNSSLYIENYCAANILVNIQETGNSRDFTESNEEEETWKVSRTNRMCDDPGRRNEISSQPEQRGILFPGFSLCLSHPRRCRNLLCRLERTFSLFESIRIEFLPKIKWNFHYLKFSTASTQLGVEIGKLCDIFSDENISSSERNSIRLLFCWYFKWTFREFYFVEIILFHLICNENLGKFQMRGAKNARVELWGLK